MNFSSLFIGILLGVIVGAALTLWLVVRWWRPNLSGTVPTFDTQALAGAVNEVANQALQHQQAQFTLLAEQSMRRSADANRAALDSKTVAIEAMVEPIHESLENVKKSLLATDQARLESATALAEQLKAMRESSSLLGAETRKLVDSLRAPHKRGAWGELQLRRIVEAAGMVKHCDFSEQFSVANSSEKHADADAYRIGSARASSQTHRPDMVVHLPQSKHLILDAKTPLSGFLDAFDAPDEASRAAALRTHSLQVRKHVESLAAKNYAASIPGSPEFVIMFMPSDNLLSAAYESDAGLMEFAMDRNVVIATPATLIALLRTVGFVWRSDAMTNNATEVLHAGRELHSRFEGFAKHYTSLGKKLDSAVKEYNATLGSFEGRLLPAARKFNTLEVTESQVAAPVEIGERLREFRSPELVTKGANSG